MIWYVWSWIPLWRSWMSILLWLVASGAGQEPAWCDQVDECQRPPEEERSVLAEVSRDSLLWISRFREANLENNRVTIVQPSCSTTFKHARRINWHRGGHLAETVEVVVASFAKFFDEVVSSAYLWKFYVKTRYRLNQWRSEQRK